MANWREILTLSVHNVEEHFDRLKYKLAERLTSQEPMLIYTYRGFGTPNKLYLKGRVLEDKGIVSARDNDNIWDNLVNMYRRFESDEIPHARVRVRFQDFEQEVQADEEGFFEVWVKPTAPLVYGEVWQDVQVDLIDPEVEQGPVQAVGQVFVPPPSARFGVISDIDDTVMRTNATHVIRMARTVFLGNARTRLPFKGVAAFYRALFHGKSGNDRNPMFYVSSGPWNLYDLLSDFFHLQDIPIGPILILRDWGITEDELLPINHHRHKLESIERILDVYTDLPFILVGDSGQEDPEIYYDVVRRYPGRILAVYIRNVSRSPKRPDSIRKLAEQVVKEGSTLILADDTLPMAQHAYEQGWISADSFPDIRAEMAKDEAPINTMEKLLGEPDPEEGPDAPTVVLEDEQPAAGDKGIEEGAIEDALELAEDETPKPPTVVVKGDEKKEPKARPGNTEERPT